MSIQPDAYSKYALGTTYNALFAGAEMEEMDFCMKFVSKCFRFHLFIWFSVSFFILHTKELSYFSAYPDCQLKAIRIHLRKEPNVFARCNTSSTGLALRGPPSLSVKHIDWQTSQRGRHKKWMAVLFYSPCPGIIIQGALGVSTGVSAGDQSCATCLKVQPCSSEENVSG